MEKIRTFCSRLTTNRVFELTIIGVILLNSILIGVETYSYNPTVALIQRIILGIFTVEIILRAIACHSVHEFFSSGWNIFDLSLVLIGYIPENIFGASTWVMAVRVVRVFRVLRLLRTSNEIKLIISVLTKSISALFYNAIFFFIFVYLFAIIGVSLFRLPSAETLDVEQQQKLAEYMQVAPNAPQCSPDPFGTLGEALFTLFRELTGEDWTDIRYNLIVASDYGLIKVSPLVITSYHVVWFVLSAFLLLNLVVGAIVNNYQIIMDESRKKRKDQVQPKPELEASPTE